LPEVSGNRKSSAAANSHGVRWKRACAEREPVRQARITNAILGQAIIEYLDGYCGGAHSLAESRIVRTGGVSDRDESSKRFSAIARNGATDSGSHGWDRPERSAPSAAPSHRPPEKLVSQAQT
jgi:hypothetical protein